MNRFWHKVKAWFGLHPRLRFWLRTGAGLILALVALAGVASAFYFHGQDSSKIKADRAAEQARVVAQQVAAKEQAQSSRQTSLAIRAVICPLVYTYEHLNQSSPNGPQVAARWHAVGALVGCPDGVKP